MTLIEQVKRAIKIDVVSKPRANLSKIKNSYKTTDCLQFTSILYTNTP